MAESYPTLLAGQRITASLLRSMQPQVGRKTADTSITASTTPVADPHITFNVEAGAVYTWVGWVKYDGATGGDILLTFTAPSGALGEWAGHGAGITVIGAQSTPTLETDTVRTNGYMQRTESNDVTQSRSFGALGVGNALTVFLKGTLRVASTAGTFALSWAQNASNATATTLYTDSYISLQRIA
ncbi:hypothetical protein [Streptomyces sp. NPDC093060]|uniref:hypothetical protein n=1 Tax=Streptomyces sp. NPDC093060 TaxID=3366019 RepID=UPI00380F9D53